MSITAQPDHDGHERGGRPAEGEQAPVFRHDHVAVAEGCVVDRRVIEGDGKRLELPGRHEGRRPHGHLRQVSSQHRFAMSALIASTPTVAAMPWTTSEPKVKMPWFRTRRA